MASNVQKGIQGEDLATELLIQNGYQILCRNFKYKFAEIDIVAQKEGLLSFIEVKSRATLDFGLACEAVNYKKQEKIRKLAEYFVGRYDPVYEEISFDIIEVYPNEKKLNHMKNVF